MGGLTSFIPTAFLSYDSWDQLSKRTLPLHPLHQVPLIALQISLMGLRSWVGHRLVPAARASCQGGKPTAKDHLAPIVWPTIQKGKMGIL